MPDNPYHKPEEMGLDAARLDRAYALLESYTKGSPAPIPGAALLVGRHGKMTEPRFFGHQGPEENAEKIRRDSAFLLASITKPVAYMAAMLLVERGLLHLQHRVTEYLPDFAAHHKEETLVLHLFTHTSGLPDMLPNNTELRKQHAPLSKFAEHVMRDTVPLFPPGTKVSYQSMGTLIAAQIVEKITGMPLPKFLKQEIFDPLGMKSSELGWQSLDSARLTRVQTPDYLTGGDYHWNSDYWRRLGSPWGGMFSTPDDFARICQLMLTGGKLRDVRILSPRTVERMTTNRLDEIPHLPEAYRRTEPWGLGWRMNQPGTFESYSDLLDNKVFGHHGATGTLTWIDRERDGFFILFTTGIYEHNRARIVGVSSVVAAAFV